MLSEICAEIKNYFAYEQDRHIGDWTIVGGIIAPSLDLPTNYVRIVGSRLNDGVHEVSDGVVQGLSDEEFHGGIWIMSVPKDFLNLVSEIEEWQDKNGAIDSANMSPFQSESFGGYSYTKKSGGTSSNGSSSSGVPMTWQSQYASRLNPWRRIRIL